MFYLIALQWPPWKVRQEQPAPPVAIVQEPPPEPRPDPLRDLEARWNAEMRTIRETQDRERRQFVEGLATREKETAELRAYVQMLQVSDTTHSQQLMDMNGVVGALREQNRDLAERATIQRTIIDGLKLEVASLQTKVETLELEKAKYAGMAQGEHLARKELQAELLLVIGERDALKAELAKWTENKTI